MKQLQNKKVLVVGLGKTGFSVCEFLYARGIPFDVVDDRETPPNIEALIEMVPDIGIHSEFCESLFCQHDVLIVSPGISIAHPAIRAASDVGASIIGDIELFAWSVDVPVIAVTGSNGKSTVVAWIDTVLSHTNIKSVLCGNIGQPVLSAIDPAAELYVLELSSFQLETTSSLKTISATVLNVSEDHLDRYDDMEHYAAVKRRIYQQCHYGVINSEDEQTRPQPTPESIPLCKPVSPFADMRVVEFGRQEPRENYYGIATIDGRRYLATPDISILPVDQLLLPGEHNVINALAVVALLAPIGIDGEQLSTGLQSFNGLRHRTELIIQHDGVRWYNDSKGTNVDACRRAIEAMGAPVVLIAGGLGKNANFSVLGPVVEEHVKALILIGRDAALIEAALKGLTDARYAEDMHDAVQLAAGIAVAGDAVLLSPACASFDMFDSFEHRGEVFSDEVLQVAA